MADPIIKLKRSAVSGKIPASDQLPLGEVALNTYDGYLYASKNVGIGTTVIVINPFRVGTGTDSYNTYFTQGNVGLGLTNPTERLHVSGNVNITGVATATNIVSVKSNDGTSGRLDLYCESNNAHYARLQAPDHGDFSGNPTIKLPASAGTLLLSDGSGASLTSLNASNLGSGTIPDARFPSTLPAVSGAGLTGLTGASADTYGDASNVAAITVDANGRITGISEVTISGGGGGSASDSFKTISVSGQTDVVADSATDTLTLIAGSNMTITTDASGDSITLASSGGGGGGVTTGKAIAMAIVFG